MPYERIRTFSRNPRGDHARPLVSLFAAAPPMHVIALTILVSSCLAGIFVFCFAGEFRRSRHSSPERDSLLPLDDEPPR
jgi:hypothetical protein